MPAAMTDGQKKDTALGVARARFVEGLERKAQEMKASAALLVGSPGADRPREEMRRRLHALYASAQVFRIDPLAAALKDAIQRLDAARDQKRPLGDEDLEVLTALSGTLPALAAQVDAAPRLSSPPAARRVSTAGMRSPVSATPVASSPGTSPAGPGAGRPGSEASGLLRPAGAALADDVDRRWDDEPTAAGADAEERAQAAIAAMREVEARVASAPPGRVAPHTGTLGGIGPVGPAPVDAPGLKATPQGTPSPATQPAPADDDAPELTLEPKTAPPPPWGDARPAAARPALAAAPPAQVTLPQAAAATPPAPRAAPAGPATPQSLAAPRPPSATGLGANVARPASTRPARTAPSGTFTATRPPSKAPPPASAASSAPGPTRAPSALHASVTSVLVVDTAEWQAKVRSALPPERYELLAAASPEEGLRLARSAAPDVVLIDRAAVTRPGADFIARLRSDPLTDFVPVILLVPPGTTPDPLEARQLGADEVLPRAFDATTLERAIARATGPLEAGSFASVGDATVEQIAERLAATIREGLVGAAEAGRDVAVPLGDGAEVLAAAWSAIARVRAHVAQRSAGRVRFRDVPRRGGPAVLALVDDDETAAEVERETEVSLDGRRILVVDDDPAIVWFFAGLLREAGAEVVEAADGREALGKLRSAPFDLVVSDILMPNLDGFGLCREMQRDPALAAIPVILLSWKEDLLSRMRELRAGARGYLRKEAGATQILGRVRDALRPRARLEAQLRAGGEVRGAVERLGVPALLATVAAHLPDARITVRDAANLFEIDLRGGDLAHVSRTATDGSFARGGAALLQLLGVSAGRYTVAPSDAPVRRTFEGGLAETVSVAAARLGALVDAVSGTGLSHVASVGIDEDTYASWASAATDVERAIAERLRGGESPRELLASGAVAPQALEGVLVDLAKRGVLTSVLGPAGEDRVAVALAAREQHPDQAFGASPQAAAPGPVRAAARPAEEVAPRPSDPGLEWLGVEESTGDIVAQASALTRAKAQEDAAPELDASELHSLPPGAVAPPAPPAPSKAPRGEESAPIPLSTPRASSPPAADAAASAPADEDAATRGGARPVEASARGATAATAASPAPGAPSGPTPDAPAGMGALGWTATLAALGLVGFFGYRATQDGTLDRLIGARPPTVEAAQATDEASGAGSADPGTAGAAGEGDPGGAAATAGEAGREEATPGGDGASGSGPAATGEGAGEAGAAGGQGASAAAAAPLSPEELRFGRVVQGITDTSVEVGPEQGLLIVEAGAARDVRVLVDDRDLGPAPIKIALPAGPHEISFRRGEEERFRYLNVRTGHTHTVVAP
jgi:CheY-like chemotaxis protein